MHGLRRRTVGLVGLPVGLAVGALQVFSVVAGFELQLAAAEFCLLVASTVTFKPAVPLILVTLEPASISIRMYESPAAAPTSTVN